MRPILLPTVLLPALVGSALAFAAPALAQQQGAQQHEGHAACAAMDADLPAGFSDWNGKAAIASAADIATLAPATLTLGKGYEAALKKTPEITFPVQPEKPGGSVAHAGLFAFNVATAGDYAVAIATPAWIDVIADGKPAATKSFGHGPECTTIRKMVVFTLQPGAHTLQISGNPGEALKLMVAPRS